MERKCSLIILDATKATIVMIFLGLTMGQKDWTTCPSECKCKWVSGKKYAECVRADLKSIPLTLSSEIQSLDLSGNTFYTISNEAFKSVGLINLHKIHLRECKIRELHKDAFKDLGILVELDLSDNRIYTLHPGTFKDNVRLRLFMFNRNPVQKLEEGLFSNLSQLQTVEMSDCRLNYINDNAFYNVSNLLHLKLDGNQLFQVNITIFNELLKLRSLVLHDNPWKCDCHLKKFRDWVIERNLYAQPTECSSPSFLKNRMWNNITSDEFACKPQIILPHMETSIAAERDDVVMLSCKATGNPLPTVFWTHNSRNVTENSKTKVTIMTKTYENEQSTLWVNLTLSQVRFQDHGQFTCIAKSPGGIDERNVSLVVRSEDKGFIGVGSVNDSWPLLIGLCTGLIALFIITTLLCCWFCCKRKQNQRIKSTPNTLPTNGDAILRITNSGEQEKSLLTVNPVQKPPRRYEAQTTSNKDAVELSELNRKLLDECSLIGTSAAGDEDRSVGSCETANEQEDTLNPEAYPPDLLSFPCRGHNVSPASSSNSNGFDNTSRTPLYTGVQPHVQSPGYHYGFGTLPYSRSHSPFTPSAPIVLPRQGYVTIPRRPRIPSWSSAPTPSLLDDPATPKAEPVYDNLGPRTTADGSSILSLNKTFPEPSRVRTPSVPNYYPDISLRSCPSPMPKEEKRHTEVLKRALSAENEVGLPRVKMPPKPPPKPKKNGPLFEDEDEDGTEV